MGYESGNDGGHCRILFELGRTGLFNRETLKTIIGLVSADVKYCEGLDVCDLDSPMSVGAGISNHGFGDLLKTREGT